MLTLFRKPAPKRVSYLSMTTQERADLRARMGLTNDASQKRFVDIQARLSDEKFHIPA